MISTAIDATSELQGLLEELYQRYVGMTGGRVATYIPQLAEADPDRFGIAVCTTVGDVVTVGDVEHPFTVQSVCKPFLYAIALTRFGRAGVHARVGVEPSGDAFDSIVRLESGTNRPHNPMINAGAIALVNLLSEAGVAASFDHLSGELGRYAGRAELRMDEATYRSEAATGDRNRAIAHLMRHLGMIEDPVETVVDLYFRVCSIDVTCRDVAVMGATLANGGVNPITRERVVEGDVVRDVLTIMSTCGMYDGTGRFAVEVGVPAKSGVSGSILGAAPGRLGLGVFSPRLDERGSTKRGLAVLRGLAERRSLHLFDPTAPTARPERAPSAARTRKAFVHTQRITRAVEGGSVASYIPELARVDAEQFALAACTVDGTESAAGDADEPFTIQAAANPFGYALALDARGDATVHEHVGVEPSGNPYDAIVFDPATGRPYNPLSNAGAIAVAALQPGGNVEDRFERLAAGLGSLAGGGRLELDEAVCRSEARFGARNRAIAYLLRNFGVIDDVEAALDLYFRQCSLLVTCRVLARMGATLAAGGRPPAGGARVVQPQTVQRVLTVMYTCGMHDASGQFAFEVGVPGKSGIAGGIVAVVPGVMGLAVFSPPVDERGASVRGFAALGAVSRELDLGVFAPRRAP